MRTTARWIFAIAVLSAGCSSLYGANANPKAESLPVGTAIRIRLDRAIDSDSAKTADTFSGHVTQDVAVDGTTVIPAGVQLRGRVLRASSPRRIQGKPSIRLRAEEIKLFNGEILPITAVVVDTGTPHKLDVDDEGRIRGAGRGPEDNREALIGTGAGAGVGALAAGGAGALVGAGVGATATTTHWLLKHRSVTIPAHTEIILELSRPATIARRAAAE